jgi:chemotaxis protein histidine kinase CheA
MTVIDSNANHAVLDAFLGEARARLAAVEQKLDALQSKPGNQVLWNGICRDFHAVTRGAAFFDVTALVELCQSVDALFDVLRDGEPAMMAKVHDTVTAAIRGVLTMIEEIAHRREPPAESVLVALLREALRDVSVRRAWQ